MTPNDRLTSEHMALLEASLDKIENDYRPTCESVPYGNGCPGATDESADFWRRAVDCIPAMLAELRALRAAALSDEEREALRWAGRELTSLNEPHHTSEYEMYKRALAVLTRLTGGAP